MKSREKNRIKTLVNRIPRSMHNKLAMDFVIIFFLLLNLFYVGYVLPPYFLSIYLRGRTVACVWVCSTL